MNIINLLFPSKNPSPPKMRQSRRGVEIKSPAEIEIMRLSGYLSVVTVDNSLSAQFEHTVLVTTDGYEIMTNR